MSIPRGASRPSVAELIRSADAKRDGGNPAAALAELDLAYLIDPENPEVRGQRGRTLAMLGRLEAAVAELDAAIGLDAGNADAWLQRGLAQLARENWAAAAADCSQALQRDAAPAAWSARAQARYRLGCYDAAIADFTAALSRHPDDADSLYGRGLALRDAGRNADAIADFTAAIARNEGCTLAYVARGKAYAARGETAAARADWAMAAQMLHQSH